MEEQKERRFSRFFGQVKKDFFYGMMVVLPLVATLWLVLFIIDLVSGPISVLFGPGVPTAINFVITIIVITFVGIAARNIIGKAVLTFFESLMIKIPIINIIYKAIKQIVNAFSFNNKSLLSAVLVEYPRKGIWAMAFVTKEDASGVLDVNGNDLGAGKCTLFVPTTPNPTSGYFIYVDKKDIVPLALSIEDSVKVLMSAGVLNPHEKSF
jgi:uncharacterized membrane protein